MNDLSYEFKKQETKKTEVFITKKEWEKEKFPICLRISMAHC